MRVNLKKRHPIFKEWMMIISNYLVHRRISQELQITPWVSQHKQTPKRILVLKWNSMIMVKEIYKLKKRRKFRLHHFKILRIIIIVLKGWQNRWFRILSSRFIRLMKRGVLRLAWENQWGLRLLMIPLTSTNRLINWKFQSKEMERTPSEMHTCRLMKEKGDHHRG